jgi:predicted oxidoreductase
MKTYRIPKTNLVLSRIGYGCMGLGGSWDQQPVDAPQKAAAAKLVAAACERGITLFDHADIYAMGKSETVFGMILDDMPGLRDKILIQSKCAVRFANTPREGDPGRYDFSYRHIVDSVDGSLRRLHTSHLDIFLLHRPDPLVQPEEVARAFAEVHGKGKVRYFGVSNHTAGQIELLRKYVEQPIVVNQVEINLLHAHLIDDGITANQAAAVYRGDAGTLDYCRRNDIQIQAWGPVAKGKLSNPLPDADESVKKIAAVVAKMAQEKGTSVESLLLAWLLRHPAPIQPIIGTKNLDHLQACCDADTIELTREEWYTLFIAARGAPMP